MKKIFKFLIIITSIILAIPIFIILLSLFISIIGCYRSLPFEPSEIKSVTFYCVDPVFGIEDYEEYLPYIEPYSYRLSLEEAQMLFRETSPYFHVGWKGRPFLGVVELENGKRHDMAMGMGSVFMVLNGSISKYFRGESATLYRELSGKLYKDYYRPFLKSKRGLNQIKENLDILEKGDEYSLEELFGNRKESLEINRQLSKIFQTSTNENVVNRFYTSELSVKEGLLCDAYETPFLFTCVSNEWSSKVNPLIEPMSTNFFVWSAGKNQSNEFGFGDDIFFPKTQSERFVIRLSGKN